MVWMLVSIIQGGISYEKMFVGNGWDIEHITQYKQVNRLTDLILFTGGSDLSPSLYGQRPHPKTYVSDRNRTAHEHQIFLKAKRKNMPMVGICRGAQLLCVENKGTLIQHVTNHSLGGTHKIITGNGEEFDVTSTHHQMMQPDSSARIVGWSTGLSKEYGGSSGETVDLEIAGVEPEVVLWDSFDMAGFQYHPEHMRIDSEAVKFFFEIVEDYVG